MEKYYKQLRVLTIVASVLAMLWIYWAVGRTVVSLIEDFTVNQDMVLLQTVVIVGYVLFAIMLVVIQSLFLINQMRSVQNGILFDRLCAKYIMAWGIVWLFYDICSDNVTQMFANTTIHTFTISGTAIGIPVIAFTFAVLYKMAADVAEENNLTI